MQLNPNSICRTCLILNNELQCIYDTKISADSSRVVADVLGDLTTIPPSKGDGMPDNICLDCLSEVKRCYLFKIECDMSDKELRKLLNISSEPGEQIEEVLIEPIISTQTKSEEEDPFSEVIPKHEVPDVDAGSDEIESAKCEEDYKEHSDDLEEIFDFIDQIQENGEKEINGDTELYRFTRRSDRNKDKHKCYLCRETFVSPTSRAQHMIEAHGDNSPCTDDEEDYVPEKETSDGKNDSVDEEEENEYRCPRCKASFVERIALNSHLKVNTCTRKQYCCPNCPKVFITFNKLEAHLLTCHKDGPSDCEAKTDDTDTGAQCTICKETFLNRTILGLHTLRIHPTEEKPFPCSTCKRRFSTKKLLNRHNKLHFESKPWKCEECPWSFYNKPSLTAHIRTHTGERPFVCKVCKKSFRSGSNLSQHRRIHTGEQPHACNFCPMRFKRLYHCRAHMLMHTGEKNYVCQTCGKKFARSQTLLTHTRSHEAKKLKQKRNK